MRFLMYALVVCLMLACGSDGISTPKVSLNTTSHEHLDVSWSDTPITADVRWRFISSEERQSGIYITGAWDITLRNPSSLPYVVTLTRLVFEDASGFQIAEYAPVSRIDTVTLSAGETRQRQGNFYFSVATVEVANTVTRMGVWASIF